MRRLSLLLICCFLTPAPVPTYHVVHGWPQLPVNDMLEEVSSVAVDSHEHVFVLTRGGRKWPDKPPYDTTAIPASTMIVFDGATGRLLTRWPNGLFALPHSVTVDDHDNVWVTDVAWHQVFEFTHDGKLLRTLGKRAVAGKDAKHFNEPSDVAVGPDGSVYVSDGYGNSRIVKFDRNGSFVRDWGDKGTKPGQFDLPHGLAVDRAGKVYVVDRRNGRIEIFNADGKYLTEWPEKGFYAAQSIKIASDGRAFIASAGKPGTEDLTGVVVLDSAGRFVQKIGRFGNYDGQFYDLHWVAISRSGAVYTADFEGKRVQKFVP